MTQFQLNQWINSIGKDRFLFFVSHIVYNMVLFIVSILAAKISGPENWGIITLFLLIATYSSLFTFGVNNGLGITLPIAIGKSDHKKCDIILSTAIRALMYSFIPIGIIQCILISIWGKSGNDWLILFGFTISFQLLSYFKMVLRSYESFNLFAFTYFLQFVCLTIGIIGLYKETHYLFLIGIVNIIASIFIWVKVKHQILKWRIKKEILQSILKIGIPVMMAGIVGELLLSVDRILISIFMDNIQLGYYGFGSNFFKGIRIIGTAMSMMLLPRIAKSYAIKDYSKMIYYARIQQWLSFTFMGIASIITGFILMNYIPLFMPEYNSSIRLSITLLGVATILPLSFYPNILNTIGKQIVYLMTQILGILLNLILSTTLILMGYGIEGVAAGSLISIAIYVLVIRYIGNRSTKHIFSS